LIGERQELLEGSPMSESADEFTGIDEDVTYRKPRRRSYLWLWLILIGCFMTMATVLYIQYGVWLHPLHEPTDLDIVTGHLSESLRGNYELISSQQITTANGPLLRVKYRQKNLAGGWLDMDRVYYVKDGAIQWSRDFELWKLEPE
jgi:hypothetical protein